ncbi:MAG: PD-(D/E)XK nuclease family protein, partial [Betaproteobacteria bacterium]|nr:PD-(D/E)XK nuclease family protein [Betaproteobacteria bacterium]
ETSWYGRIAQAVEQGGNPLLAAAHAVVPVREKLSVEVDAALLRPLPVGQHAPRMTAEQRRGIWLHALLQYLAPPSPLTPLSQAGEGSAVAREREVLQQRCGIPAGEMESLWQQAHHLLALPALQRYFDPRHYRSACNEMPYVNARGELKRIDRLVEFDGEVWVLDYKTSESANPAPYVAQLAEYRAAMQAVYANKKVRCALLFADGTLCEAG